MYDRLGKLLKDDSIIIYDDNFYILQNVASGKLQGFLVDLRHNIRTGLTTYQVNYKVSNLKRKSNALLVELRDELHEAIILKVIKNRDAVSNNK